MVAQTLRRITALVLDQATGLALRPGAAPGLV